MDSGLTLVLFSLFAFGTLAVLFLYPFALWLRTRLGTSSAASASSADAAVTANSAVKSAPTVSLLVTCRNSEALLPRRFENRRELSLPDGQLQVVWVSDGSTDRTAEMLREEVTPRSGDPKGSDPDRAVILETNLGKAEALNRGAAQCDGEIIVFSDVDAILAPDAIEKLLRHFEDPSVGGVCGRRTLERDLTDLTSAQSSYVGFDSRIKMLESRRGSITSNDGKLYAIRRQLFRSVVEAVTDDLYVALTVIDQGARFVFEPEARAYIPTPSRSARHELGRRRRVVCRSLRGIARMRHLLDPRRTGFFGFGLFVNKILRRAMPFFLVGVLVTTALLARSSTPFRILCILEWGLIAAAVAFPLVRKLPLGPFVRALSIPFYFGLGNLGTLLGVLDFFWGRRVVRWEPQKSGGTA